jgi:hypothetical protein
VSSSESQAEKVQDLKARVLILQQQQLRLAQQADSQAAKASALDSATSSLHKDMGRLNEFIGDATRHCTYGHHTQADETDEAGGGSNMTLCLSVLCCSELCNENVLKEKEFVEQLAALEHEAAQADDKLRTVLDAKHNVRHTAQ